ncbi:MAG TPA: peptidoglycan recognition family protein [Segeticoccus sp.]|uniref:N-acetylmuramoyl-L-alanine amidase n=1 Tax=Segeticoccus sp. TaxID=2706531 RepID=UPI002D7F539B|nr:peptidoglycan recognition family protein [Segeticoccus sp.]HET8600792.1 peptidoglycan recognition family protein [Segeticoccus sp.]
MRTRSGSRLARGLALFLGAGLVGAVAPAAVADTGGGDPAARVDCSWATSTSVPLEQAFARSAQAAAVPEPLLKAVSYMESRWDAHPGAVSADGGWGPMNLTDAPAVAEDGRGVGQARRATSQQTAPLAAQLTGLTIPTLKANPAANVCGGAAVLSAYQGKARGQLGDWTAAVARYGTAGSGGDNQQFAHQVYATMRQGQQRTTAQEQRVSLAAHPSVNVPPAARSTGPTDCPADLGCEWVPAPYAKLDPNDPDSTGNYGNHDIADRTGINGHGTKGSPKLRYIVIHDTEGSYASSVGLVQDPSYLGWNYTIRSADGHVAQHMNARDVGWHAGNWYVNMHSIGIEHEGKGGNAGWFTEAMYQNSADLVRYLAREYGIPVDRAHIIGHDQVPGILAGYTRGMHWDPGPYWDWEHYFDLLRKPLGGHRKAVAHVTPGEVVTVRPGYAGNTHLITQCEQQSPGSGPCLDGAPTNFVALRQVPSDDAPLAKDVAVRPGSSAGSTVVSDVSARAQAGVKLVVADVQGEWVKVSWAGEFAWLRNPADDPVLVPAHAWTVTVTPGADSAPVYGRAYPEKAAYPDTISPQTVSPIEYTLKPGQAYALTDDRVVTDYYRAVSFDGSAPGDRTDVVGQDRYLQISLAHRIAYVRAADVEVHRN